MRIRSDRNDVPKGVNMTGKYQTQRVKEKRV